MDINIKISDEQVQRLKDFGLGGIFESVMKGMDPFDKRGPRWFFDKQKSPWERAHRFPLKLIPKDKEELSSEEIKSIEGKARKELYNDVKELFEIKKKAELLKLVLERLSPHSLALLIQK